MGAPSTPGWKAGYVPSAGEWNNTFGDKADYPVPAAQGGTGQTYTPEDNQILVGSGGQFALNTVVGADGVIVTFADDTVTFSASPVGAYPPAGIPQSTGTEWAGSYAVTGTGFHVVLSNNAILSLPTIADTLSFEAGSFSASLSGNPAATSNAAYVLPATYPSSDGYYLSSTARGALSWASPPAPYTSGTGITISGSTISLANTVVSPGSYVLANVTFNAQGQATAASNAATTGTGNVVLATSPVLVTPNIGVAIGTSLTITTGQVTTTPANPNDFANKAYVDAVANGLSPKASVQHATTAALPTNTYANGASGVGATLTAIATGALVVDGIVVTAGDRVLVKNEVAGANNGIYLCTVAGATGVAYVLTRTSDSSTQAELEGAFCFVEQGTVNAGSGWVNTNAGPITIGTTPLVYTQFSGVGTYTAGNGLILTGSQFAISATPNLGTPSAINLANATGLAATQVSANDGSSGSLFTTLQGFITYLLSSAGGTFVKWAQAATGAVSRGLSADLALVVRPEQFGAVGNGTTDDTAAIQAAINYVASLGGGTVQFANKTYKVQASSGTTVIGAYDDGTSTNGNIAPQTPNYQSYCLNLIDGVTLQGSSNTVFQGAYTYGNASLSELICVNIGLAAGNLGVVFASNVRSIIFNNYFMAVANVAGVTATSNFDKLAFNNCAFGMIFRSLERCVLGSFVAQSTGVVLCVGGFWCSRNNTYNSNGGYMDKCSLTCINNVYQRVAGASEAAIDTYFNTYFFQTANNTSRLAPGTGGGQATLFPYYGVCGRSVYVMARYSRLSNSNSFSLVSHAYSFRASVWFDYAIGNNNSCAFYLESCGYQDNVNRVNPVGVGFTDPYLGAGVEIPYFIKQIQGIVDAQYVYGTQICQGTVFPTYEAACTLANSQASTVNLTNTNLTGGANLSSGRLTVNATTKNHSIGMLGITSVGFTNAGTDTGIAVNAGGGGKCMLVLVSRNLAAGTNTNSSVSMINFPYDGSTTPIVTLISGTASLFTLSVSGTQTLVITAATANNYDAVFLGNNID